MLRFTIRSLTNISNKSTQNLFRRQYSDKTTVQTNKQKFERFKKQSQILREVSDELNYEVNGIEIPKTEKKLDLEFLNSQMSFDGKVRPKVDDFISGKVKSIKGYEHFDMSKDETVTALAVLQDLLQMPYGKAAVDGIMKDIRVAFGMDSDEVMEMKAQQLNKETSLKLGEDVEQFLAKNGGQIDHLPKEQYNIIREYHANHPYLTFGKQIHSIISLIDLSSRYNTTDAESFDKEIKKYFQIEENKNTDIGKPTDEVGYIRDQDPHPFVQNSNFEAQENAMVDLIKSGTLSKYFRDLVESARDASNPSAKKAREIREEKTEKEIAVLKEINEKKLREMLEQNKNLEQIKKQEILNLKKQNFFDENLEALESDDIDRNLGAIQSLENPDSNAEFAHNVDGEVQPEENIYDDENIVKEIIPEIDMILPEELQDQAQDPRDLLKYYYIYPKQVRKWVDYTHTPQGLFTSHGVWYNLPEWYSEHFKPSPPPVFIAPESKGKNVFQQAELPEDLRSAYRFGVTEEEVQNVHPKLKEFLSFRNASQPEVSAYRKQVAINKYGDSPYDSGNSSVQIAVFTVRANALKAHIEKNKKDFVAKRRLLMLESRRDSMLNYLKRTDIEGYYKITKDLKLKNF